MREAQGHALTGDLSACRRALEQGQTLLAGAPAPYPYGPSWGPNTIDDDCALVEAWCLVDLGLPRAAADLFDADPGCAVPAAARTRVRFAVRGALAHALAGQAEHACELLDTHLTTAERTDSATIRTDLRRLTAVLTRHRRHPPVRAILPEIHHVLRAC